MAKGIYKHKPLTEQHKANIATALSGKMPKHVVGGWNKGLRGLYKTSDETKLKQSLAHLGKNTWMKGRYLGPTHPMWKGGLPSCRDCGKILTVRHPLTSRCKPCSAKLRSGPKNPNWRGGITPLVLKIRSSGKYKEWRQKIFIRDNFTCQKCGERGGKIVADHILPFATIMIFNKIDTLKKAMGVNFLWEVLNGRTLCESCHKKTPTYMGGTIKFTKMFMDAQL